MRLRPDITREEIIETCIELTTRGVHKRALENAKDPPELLGRFGMFDDESCLMLLCTDRDSREHVLILVEYFTGKQIICEFNSVPWAGWIGDTYTNPPFIGDHPEVYAIERDKALHPTAEQTDLLEQVKGYNTKPTKKSWFTRLKGWFK